MAPDGRGYMCLQDAAYDADAEEGDEDEEEEGLEEKLGGKAPEEAEDQTPLKRRCHGAAAALAVGGIRSWRGRGWAMVCHS